MKQSILFEQGKLYVVELPEEKEFDAYYADGHVKGFRLSDYNDAYSAAFDNKVEVKNPEELPFKYVADLTKDGDTFPLPDGIEVEIKHEWPNPCIPYNKCMALNDMGTDSACKQNCVRQVLVSIAILKRIEPEKPEETQEVTLKEFLADIPPLYHKQETFVYTNLKLRGYTIQRKKS